MPAFVPVAPPRDPDECWPWLYEAISRLNRQAAATNLGLGAIVRGETPDASGNPLVDTSRFFVKPGLSLGQIAFGGIGANENLWLSSTANGDKGFVYLGYPNIRVALDEDAGFLGVGTTAPSAVVHTNVASAGTTTTGATGTPMLRGSIAGSTLFDFAPIQFSPGVYDVSLKMPSSALQMSADATSGMRMTAIGGRAFYQAGYKDSGGTAQAMNMTLGGIGALVGTNIGIAFDQVFFNGTTFPKVGVAVDPTIGTWKGVVAIRANSTTEPALTVANNGPTDDAPAFEFRHSLSGSFGTRLISMRYNNTGGQGQLVFWHTDSVISGYFWTRPSEFANGKITVYDRNSRRAMSWDSGTLWSDSKTTCLIDVGDTVSSHSGAVLAGIDAAVLSRFAIMSTVSLVTNVLVGGAVAPPTAMWHVRAGSGTGNVLLALQRITSQTADLLDMLDNDGTTRLSYFDKDGKYATNALPTVGNIATDTNVAVDDAGNVITADGNIVLA